MKTSNMEETYQKIANSLVNIIPEDWQKIYLYAEYREGYEQVFFYYYPETDSNPIYSLDIPKLFNIDSDSFQEMDQQLYDLFSELWNEFRLQNEEQWTNVTFILDNNGSMKVEYGYEDLFGLSPIDKQDKWEEKYLN